MSFNKSEREKLFKQVSQQVKKILQTEKELEYQEDLKNSGLDSFNAVKLIVSLEETFNVSFNDEDLELRNFSTISNILKVVMKSSN